MCTISNLKCWNCNNHRIITPRNDDRGATNQQIKLARAHCGKIIFDGGLLLHFNETCLKNLSYDSIKSNKKRYFESKYTVKLRVLMCVTNLKRYVFGCVWIQDVDQNETWFNYQILIQISLTHVSLM